MSANAIDEGRLSLMLNDLRLPTIKQVWPDFAARSDKEGWQAARFLATLAEHELADRSRRRIARHLEEARLPAHRATPWTASTSRLCPWSSRRRSLRWRPAIPGWK